MGLFSSLFGSNEREVEHLQPHVLEINTFAEELERLPDSELKDRFQQLRARVQEKLKQHEEELKAIENPQERAKREHEINEDALEGVLTRAFAAVREAGQRTLGLRHFDVQLVGGVVLHQGKIAEMRTGEGKTLVATLPLALNALTGKGVHLVTVNGYLARRDAGWMGPLYHALGLTVGVIDHDTSYIFDPAVEIESETDERLRHFRPVSRQEAYRADITYGTNNEFGFDYLRDNMVSDIRHLAQRPANFAIVDEVDSILIDEARTPLIISAAAEESGELYQRFAQLVPKLKREEDYTVDEKQKAVSITDSGIKKMEQWLGVDNIYDARGVAMVHHLEEALRAHAMYKKDVDYVVKEGEILIVDEFTGRLMPGRRFSHGLHQALEAKEGVEVKRESDTLATISFQNLFRMYPKLAGMTGTAATEAEEFHKIYKLDVVEIPTHRPMVRQDRTDLIYKTEEAKYNAVVEHVKERLAVGQPILIGTISVEKSERLSRLLKRSGVKHEVLNAKNHIREAKIIENAGKPGAVTVATNMAGRGVDIILGGKPPTDKEKGKSQNSKMHEWEANHQKVLEADGLFVIGTERHESRRIDNQLRGRSGRQGDPGVSLFYVSMEDDLMRIFGGDRLKAVMQRLGLPDDMPIEHKLISRSIESAQKKVEGHNFDIRKHLVEYDDVMNKHREVVYRRRARVLEGKGVIVQGEGDDRTLSYVNLREEILNLMGEEERKTYLQRMAQYPPEVVARLEQVIYLRAIDTLWIEHLNSMDSMREGIGLRGYGQHDPLVAYKEESFRLFQGLVQAIENDVVQILSRVELKAAPQVTDSQTSQPAIVQAPAPTQFSAIHPEPEALAPEKRMESEVGEEVEEEQEIKRVAEQPQTLTDPSISQEKKGDVNVTVRPAPRSISEVGSPSGITPTVEEQQTDTSTGVTTVVRRPAIEMRGASESLAGGGFASQEGEIQSRLSTTRTIKAKVGRNEPCPCGSGKKFKKCHGR
jgi:preprotein translocase subunit SecA